MLRNTQNQYRQVRVESLVPAHCEAGSIDHFFENGDELNEQMVRYVCENVKKCIKVFNNREAAPQQRVFAGYR